MADSTTLARPYAKAAFEVARDTGTLAGWAAALQIASGAASDPVVQRLISDPNVDNATLTGLFAGAEGSEPDGYDNFVQMLIDNDRLRVLPEILRLFENLRAEAERTIAVTVRTATELSEEYRQRLREKLGKRYNREISLDVVVDEQMIGGAIIQAGDQVIDGSLRRQLNLLGEALKS